MDLLFESGGLGSLNKFIEGFFYRVGDRVEIDAGIVGFRGDFGDGVGRGFGGDGVGIKCRQGSFFIVFVGQVYIPGVPFIYLFWCCFWLPFIFLCIAIQSRIGLLIMRV